MATLKQQLALVIDWLRQRHPEISVGEQCAQELEAMVRRSMPGEKVYVPAPDTSRKKEIAAAAKFLPTNVVAERFGVSRAWVRRVVSSGRGGAK